VALGHGFTLGPTAVRPSGRAIVMLQSSSAPEERERAPSTNDLRMTSMRERKQAGLYQMAERVFGDSQGAWVHDKMSTFGGTGAELTRRVGREFD